MSEDSKSEDELNFDDDNDNSPKMKAQVSQDNEDLNDILSDESDDYNRQKYGSASKQVQSATKNTYNNEDDDDDLHIFDEDSDEDNQSQRKPQKAPEKQKQIQKEKQYESQKTQARRPQQMKEKQPQVVDKRKQAVQQRNQSSAGKKQSNGTGNLRNKNDHFSQQSMPQKPLIDDQTKQKVNEQTKNVQHGYENKEALTVLTRSVLETAQLRNFHNWIKSVIIKKYSDEMKDIIKIKEDLRTTTGQLFVMEIACGQGGDLKKWLHADIALYIGVDISFNSLKEASRRSKEILEKLPPNQQYKKFKYGFYQKDGSAPSEEFWKNIIDKEKDQDRSKRFFFDLVSCQMAMHYMFGSETHARNFFQNATQRLNDQGFLILTCSDSNAIVKKMRSRSQVDPTTKKHVFSNKYFSMAFDSLNFPPGNPYGLKYEFYLQDAVGEKDQETGQIKYTPEYLVELNNLTKLALEYSLNIKENLNFIEFYKNYRTKYGYLFRSMGLDKFNSDHPSIDPELWEISHCYRVIIFQKIDLMNRDNKKYSFNRNANLKSLSQEVIPINYVQSQPEKRPPKY